MNFTLTQPEAEHTGNTDSRRLAGLDLAGIAALGAVIAIHTSELSGKVDETAYLGFGYVLLIAASIVSIVLLAQRDLRGWILGGLTAVHQFCRIGKPLRRGPQRAAWPWRIHPLSPPPHRARPR